MSDAIPRDQFPPWKAKIVLPMSKVALALGLVEEVIGDLDGEYPALDRVRSSRKTLKLARGLLREATEADAARVPMALLTPITDEEAGQ